jgi:hypothetical protein
MVMAKKKQKKKGAKTGTRVRSIGRKGSSGAGKKTSPAKAVRKKQAPSEAKKQHSSTQLRAADPRELTVADAADTLGLDRATDIVSACAEGQDPGTATIGDVGNAQIFQTCVVEGTSDAGYTCAAFPLSSSTKLSDVIAAIAKSLPGTGSTGPKK